MDRIHRYATRPRFASSTPLGRDISVRLMVEYQYAFWGDGNVDLAVNPIHDSPDRKNYSSERYLRMRPLDHPNGRFLSIGPSTEYQDCLRQRTGDDDFIVNRIIRKTMHRPADQCLLTLQRSYRWCIFPRQPGEGRNLRMDHSIRDQDLLPLGCRIPGPESCRIFTTVCFLPRCG